MYIIALNEDKKYFFDGRRFVDSVESAHLYRYKIDAQKVQQDLAFSFCNSRVEKK